MNYYSQSINNLGSMELFKTILTEDFEVLSFANVDLSNIPALLDKIAYDLE